MSAAEAQYITIGQQIAGTVQSQMFGKPCFKVNGKAFISFFDDCMVFKLTGTAHQEAMALKGALAFDPSGKGRPMKAWVQVPAMHQNKWPELAKAAQAFVSATS